MSHELFRLQSMQNLTSIGHEGNVTESSGSSGSASGRDIYGGMFEGGGANIVETMNELLNSGSFTAKFMTLGAINIFDAVKAGPLLFGNLDNLSLMNFLDFSKSFHGFQLPLPLSLPSKNKGRGK